MSKKHNQRTREEILAKRKVPIEEIPVRYKLTGLPVIKKVKISKYMPHFGNKQRAKWRNLLLKKVRAKASEGILV